METVWAHFENVLIGSGYVLEEVDTPIRYVVPDSQTATIEWNEVTHKSVNNVLKKFRVTVHQERRGNRRAPGRWFPGRRCVWAV